MSWRELWSIHGKVKKFWKIKLSGKALTEHFGRLGTAGERRTKEFPTREAAAAAYEKLIQKKLYWNWFDKPDPNNVQANIFLAAETGDLAGVRKCLRMDPEAVHYRWETEQPLHRAVRNGHCEVARLLLESGADINARGEGGQVPVLYALNEVPDFKMVGLLLEYHPDLTIADDLGMTPLYLGTSQKEIAQFLREKGVALDPDPTPHLISLLETKGAKEVEKKLQANSAMARSPRIGDFAQVAMVYPGAGRLMKLLLDNGLDPNWTSHGDSLLHAAIFRDSPGIVQALLEKGADPNRKGGQGDPLLIEAWRYGHKKRKAICDLLIQHGARKDLTADLYLEGVKPVIAKIQRNPKLLESVADPVDLLNHTIAKRSPELVELLLNHGVDPNAHGRTKEAPLRCAVRFGSFRIVQLLLEHGADPNPVDTDTIEGERHLCDEVTSRVLNYKSGVKLQELLLAHGMTPRPT